MTKYIYTFAEANPDDVELLGGKGAGLARMTQKGYPVPPGFIITTDVCKVVMAGDLNIEDFNEQLFEAMLALEKQTGQTFGGKDEGFPLLVSVRSGAPVSMPGMMETILNVGITPSNLKRMGNPRFSIPTYVEFLGRYGNTVLGQTSQRLKSPVAFYKAKKQLEPAAKLTDEQLRELLVVTRDRVVRGGQSLDVIDNPYIQLNKAIRTVIDSWMGPNAMEYRTHNTINDQMGTAVIVVAMVFGNRDEQSGSGVLFSRDPSTGENKPYGEFDVQAQGEAIVGGTTTPKTLDFLREWNTPVYDQLMILTKTLETDQGDAQDIEYTVDSGTLWLLQHRSAKRTSKAAIRMAVEMHSEGLITKEVAASRVTRLDLRKVDVPTVKITGNEKIAGTGLAASTGVVSGVLAIANWYIEECIAASKPYILAREMTTPNDVRYMLGAEGFATGTGGTTCHAAVVARGENKPCVVGISEWIFEEFEPGKKIIRTQSGQTLQDGTLVTVDGDAGLVYSGELEVEPAGDNFFTATIKEWHEELGLSGIKLNIKFNIGLSLRSNIQETTKPVPQSETKYWWPELEINLDTTKIAADFYLLSESARINPELKPVLEQFAEVVAKDLAIYLDAACGGEARHSRTGYRGLLRGSRNLARKEWRILRQTLGVGLLLDLRDAFNDPDQFTGSFGGEKWANGAELLHHFLVGEINAVTFVDLAFDLQHNSGCMFNKIQYHGGIHYGWNLTKLDLILDWKLHGKFGSLLKHSSKNVADMFSLCEDLDETNVEIMGLEVVRDVWVKASESILWKTVRISDKARNIKIRGLVGKVINLKTFKRDGLFVEVMVNGEKHGFRLKNIEVLEPETSTLQRQYFGEGGFDEQS
ncbi:hypothetical protein LCGC14_0263730 [marine sediment metagenome]|uniref:Pyruvate, phosphate dikinase n=1 Tax=marine sediment metagenome TaxID=412755 RepID=A0A0F9U5E1_9ZZZZ